MNLWICSSISVLTHVGKQAKAASSGAKKGLAASRFADGADDDDEKKAEAGETADAAAEGESGDEPDGSSAALALVRAPLCTTQRCWPTSSHSSSLSLPFPYRLTEPRFPWIPTLTHVLVQMAKARVTARGLQELDDDMRDRNARYVNFYFG